MAARSPFVDAYSIFRGLPSALASALALIGIALLAGLHFSDPRA